MTAISCLFKLFIVAVSIFLIHSWIKNKQYLIDEDELHSLARRHIITDKHLDAETSMKLILNDLRERYDGHILSDEYLQWVFINCGGWMGSINVIHASLTEYILFFGSAVYTTGHSGRYLVNVSDTLLSGAMTQWKEGTLTNHTFVAGDTVKHVWGDATSVTFHGGTWMLEYGRGFIPSTLTFGLADTIFSTHDVLTLFYILRVYTYAIIQETTFYLSHLF
ncbi:sigma non-opioid intracellular receptor 1-like [Tubulanus polymorphus]|uniref:sigma non-opioid intracellular receptor 1-like n=1 Tax=Tubulanus polymorphus TaxID=672921 RepID=UPI003DA6B03E